MIQSARNLSAVVPNRDGQLSVARRPDGGLVDRIRSNAAAAIVFGGLAATFAWTGFLGWSVFVLVRWATS